MVQEKDKDVAFEIADKLSEYNWERKDVKTEDIDITKDIIPQTWRIGKKIKKRKRK